MDRVSAWTARAPGRLDVMGGIADYSGSLVLQWPIRESTRVTMQFQPWQFVRIVTRDANGGERELDVPLELINAARPSYGEIRAWFAETATRHWAAYVAGVFAVLAGEHGIRFSQGALVTVESDVPEGKGVSSSAALEAATMTALVAALSDPTTLQPHNLTTLQPSTPTTLADPRALALLCQRAENLVVGAPCGVMDQMSVICGKAGHLMALLCQPAELCPPLRLPPGLAVFGIDSGIRHAVTGSDYTAVRIGAFMGYRILADLAGLAVGPGERDDHVVVDDPRWGGYLANVGSAAFHEYEVHIPNTLSGSLFLKRYGGTTDLVTTVDPDRCYAIWTPTAHPVYEHERVTEWSNLLQPDQPDQPASNLTQPGPTRPNPIGQTRESRLGELMYASHASYSACGLGSDGTDLLVDLARAAGAADGIYGAKITGGGSGGTVAILAREDAADRVHRIAAEYAERTAREPYVFEGTSDGAAITGAIQVG
jgi:L-arabinokinase